MEYIYFSASPTPQNRNSSSEIPLPQIRILSFRCAILCTKSFWRSNCDPGCLKRSGRNDDGRMRWCHVDVTWCNRGMYRVSMIHDYTKLYTHANMSTLVYFSLLYIYTCTYIHRIVCTISECLTWWNRRTNNFPNMGEISSETQWLWGPSTSRYHSMDQQEIRSCGHYIHVHSAMLPSGKLT